LLSLRKRSVVSEPIFPNSYSPTSRWLYCIGGWRRASKMWTGTLQANARVSVEPITILVCWLVQLHRVASCGLCVGHDHLRLEIDAAYELPRTPSAVEKDLLRWRTAAVVSSVMISRVLLENFHRLGPLLRS